MNDLERDGSKELIRRLNFGTCIRLGCKLYMQLLKKQTNKQNKNKNKTKKKTPADSTKWYSS